METLMTVAPLPAPLPANCPLCNAAMEPVKFLGREPGWMHTLDPEMICPARGITLSGTDEIAAWNRRAPEAQAWRAPGVSWIALSDERPPEKAGQYALLHGARMEPIMVRWHSVYRVWEGDWPGERRSLDDILTMFTEDGDTFTHWAPVAPPGATPAAPPAREAALVEALREAREFVAATWGSLRGVVGDNNVVKPVLDRIDAALAEAEGRAK